MKYRQTLWGTGWNRKLMHPVKKVLKQALPFLQIVPSQRKWEWRRATQCKWCTWWSRWVWPHWMSQEPLCSLWRRLYMWPSAPYCSSDSQSETNLTYHISGSHVHTLGWGDVAHRSQYSCEEEPLQTKWKHPGAVSRKEPWMNNHTKSTSIKVHDI